MSELESWEMEAHASGKFCTLAGVAGVAGVPGKLSMKIIKFTVAIKKY